MRDNYFEKIIPEHNIKFAFMRKVFMPRAVIIRRLFDYIETTEISRPFCIISKSVAEKHKDHLEANPFSGGTIIKIKGEPTIKQIKELTKKCSNGKYDALIGVGGGSVLDTAKAIKNHLDLPLIVSPATPSSGSETTPYALIIDEKINSKILIHSSRIVPNVVVLDNSLLETISPREMGYFLFDILGHCIEGLVSKMATNFSDAFAQKGIEITSEAYFYLKKPYPKEKLSLIQTAGFLGGLTQGMASVGMAHSLAHYFGSRYNIPHAKAISIFLPEVVRINAHFKTYNKLNSPGENNGAEYLLKLFKKIERSFGLKKEKINVGHKFQVEEAIVAIQKDFCAPTNPIKFENKDFIEIFKNTLLYEN